METLITVLIYIISTTFTYIFGKISKEKGWNDDLPIPTQNAIVGVIVFALAILLGYILKLDIDPQYIAKQIFVSLSGSFSATWGYDFNKENQKKKELDTAKDAKGE